MSKRYLDNLGMSSLKKWTWYASACYCIKWLTSIANTPSMKMVQSRLTGHTTTIYIYIYIYIDNAQLIYSKIPATTAFPGRAIVYKRQLPSSLLPVESFCLNSNIVLCNWSSCVLSVWMMQTWHLTSSFKVEIKRFFPKVCQFQEVEIIHLLHCHLIMICWKPVLESVVFGGNYNMSLIFMWHEKQVSNLVFYSQSTSTCDRVCTVFESLGKMGCAFQGLETESLGKLSGVCEFYGLQSAWEKVSAYQSETAFPKTKQ